MRIVPCKNCSSRRVGCHSKCTTYLLYKLEREDMRMKRARVVALADYEYAHERSKPRR